MAFVLLRILGYSKDWCYSWITEKGYFIAGVPLLLLVAFTLFAFTSTETGNFFQLLVGFNYLFSVFGALAGGMVGLGLYLLLSREPGSYGKLREMPRKLRGVPRGVFGPQARITALEKMCKRSNVYTSIVRTFCEELLWRGILLYVLINIYGINWPVSLAISTIAFGSIHYYFGVKAVACNTFNGLIFGALFLMTWSIIPSFVAHVTCNQLVFRNLREKLRVLKIGRPQERRALLKYG